MTVYKPANGAPPQVVCMDVTRIQQSGSVRSYTVQPGDGQGWTLRLDLVERRLVYAMLNEAAMACAENVVRSPRDGDVGAIFAIGFPPVRGGMDAMIRPRNLRRKMADDSTRACGMVPGRRRRDTT